MTGTPVKFESVWVDTTPTPVPDFPALAGDVTVDACIVGAGIAGLTTAVLLAREGKTVAVVDAGKVAMGDSGYTTALLTAMLDEPYSQLAQTLGADTARVLAQSNRHAIDVIQNLSETLGIACDFKRVNGFLFSPHGGSEDETFVNEECRAALAAGLTATVTRDVPLPFPAPVAVRFEHQGQFHPRQYLLGLARWLSDNGQRVYENTNVTTVTPRQADGWCRVQAQTADGPNGTPATYTVKTKHVVLCTGFPFVDDALANQITTIHTYVIAAVLPTPGARVQGLFVDTEHPYHYLRAHALADGRTLVIVGGEDHKAGEGDADEKFANLQTYVQTRFPGSTLAYRWSGVTFERPHAVPYIGPSSIGAGVSVACAFAGNGMTGGTIAGQLLTDAILGKTNAWAETFARA